VAVREVRLRNLVSLARAKDDVSTLVSALQEKVIRLEKVEDEQYNEYCGVVARLESCEGELREANEELKQKEFQVVVLTSALSEKSETVQEESPFQIFKSNIEAKQVQIPIICIRSKQDPSFIEAIAESLKVEPSELQDYFEEEIREYSSNLIKNLISAHSGKVVLYAHAHLKYFAPEGKKDFPEFFAGAKVRDSVSRFIQWIT
jgi:dsDNA-specific endonuclease/ATPase MutS2